MVSTLPANFDLEQYIQGLYQDVLGREPDNGGRAWWVNDPQVQGWLETGGVPKLESAFISGIQGPEDTRFHDIKSNLVPYANNLTQDMAFEWNKYMNEAAAQQRGMNNMPGVFSDYTALAYATPDAVNGMMYNTADQQKAALEAASKYWQTAGGFGGLGASAANSATPATTTNDGRKTIDVDGTTYYLNQGRFVPQGSN